jgi:hypothetical protein
MAKGKGKKVKGGFTALAFHSLQRATRTTLPFTACEASGFTLHRSQRPIFSFH